MKSSKVNNKVSGKKFNIMSREHFESSHFPMKEAGGGTSAPVKICSITMLCVNMIFFITY